MSSSPTQLETWVEVFLANLKQVNYSPHTLRAYARDLRRFAESYNNPPQAITVEDLRNFLASFAHLKPATRARKQAALNSFFTWASRQDLLPTNPLARLSSEKSRISAP